MADTAKEDKHWHIKREIPVAVILALVVQGAVIVGGLSKMDSRVAQLESRREEDAKALVATRAEDRARLVLVEKAQVDGDKVSIRIDEQLKTLSKTLERVEAKLEAKAAPVAPRP